MSSDLLEHSSDSDKKTNPRNGYVQRYFYGNEKDDLWRRGLTEWMGVAFVARKIAFYNSHKIMVISKV